MDETKSILDDIREYHIVEVLNPLARPFQWQVGRSGVDPGMPMDSVMEQLGMAGAGGKPQTAHAVQTITLPAGKTFRMPGDLARIVVKHLIDELMQIDGQTKLLSDPTLRLKYEEKIIKNRSDLRSTMSTLSLQEQLDKELATLNDPDGDNTEDTQVEEEAFPDAKELDKVIGTETPKTE
jgi:hypothetical protein